MEEAFIEVAKSNFVLAVFVVMLVVIGMLLYGLFVARMKQVDAKIAVMENDVKSIRENVHKLGNSVNVAMSNVQAEIREVNSNVKFLAIKMGKDPMEFLEEKK